MKPYPRCKHCGARLRQRLPDDHRQRGEFPVSHYANLWSVTIPQARARLNRGVIVALYAKRKLGREWLYRKNSLVVEKA